MVDVNKAQAIMHKYPAASPRHDFEVRDDGDGVQYIAVWNVQDVNGDPMPEPTDEELATWYAEWEAAKAAELPDPKEIKLAELNIACNAAILAGFESSALGESNVYDFDYEAQINLAGMLQAITNGMISEPITWKASGIPLPHTFDQFKQVYADGLAFKNAQVQHYWELKAQVQAAETQDEIEAIVW
jgi:hypothetical protein